MNIVLLSGPIACGKTSVADVLIKSYEFQKIRTGAYLSKLAREKHLSGDRTSLQTLGDQLDIDTDYSWLISQVSSPAISANPMAERWLIDSVRKKRQTEHFRDSFGDAILHVHLMADEACLRQRYEERLASGDEYLGNTPYDAAIQHPNEIAARSLVTIADLVLDTGIETASTTALSIVAALRRT